MRVKTRTIYRNNGLTATFDGDGNLLAADDGFFGARNEGESGLTVMVQPDIAAYQSQVTGEMITSRSQHREHLRKHGLIEVGNETQSMMKKRDIGVSPESRERRKRLLHQVVDQNLGYLRRGHR